MCNANEKNIKTKCVKLLSRKVQSICKCRVEYKRTGSQYSEGKMVFM